MTDTSSDLNFLAARADQANDAAFLSTPGPREIRVSRFNAAQTRHYFRICQMYSSARTAIARNSLRRLYRAAGINCPTWCAPELDESVEGPIERALKVRPVVQVQPLLRRQAR